MLLFSCCSEHDGFCSILFWHWLRWRNPRWLRFFLCFMWSVLLTEISNDSLELQQGNLGLVIFILIFPGLQFILFYFELQIQISYILEYFSSEEFVLLLPQELLSGRCGMNFVCQKYNFSISIFILKNVLSLYFVWCAHSFFFFF